MENRDAVETGMPETAVMNLKPGMKVYGILRLMQDNPINRDRTGTYHGIITEVTEKGFSVKYDVVKCPLPYDFKSLGHIVFIDKNACLEQEVKKDGPQLEEGFFDVVSEATKKEKTEGT